MFRHIRLDEENGFFGINADGEKSGRGSQNTVFELLRVLRDGDGMQINDRVDAIIGLLHHHPVLKGSDIVAKVDKTARLNA